MSEVKDYPPYLDYPKPKKKQTNGDRVRAMTDEKLAQWLTFIEMRILDMKPDMTRSEMFADWLDWLKQEMSDGNQKD